MKTTFKTTILATSLMLALTTACSTKNESAESAKKIQITNQMKSEELVDAGEQLVSPYAFMLSDKVFDMALEKDPSNKKAQFYKLFIKRMMVFKGIVNRIKPIMDKSTPRQKADYEKSVRDFPNSPLKKFLLDGPQDIHSAAQAMSILSEYNKALNEFRIFLKKNQNMEITLNLNPYLFQQSIEQEAANSCTWKEGAEGAIDVTCDTVGIAQKKLNVADVIALRQVTSGEMLMWSMYTAYDLSVIEKIQQNEQLKNVPPQEALAYYKTLPSLAKLNKDHTLNLIPEIGTDLSAAIKWAKQYQDRVCPKGHGVENQRRGFLFSSGMCIENTQDTDKTLALLDQAMSGVFAMPINNEEGRQVDQIRVNLVGFLKAPPQDLKTLLPESVDQDGDAIRFTDNTLGGLLPDGDAHKIVKKK